MRVPALKQPVTPDSMRAYVGQVKTYAADQFRKGLDDRAVISNLRQAGSVYTIRFVVETEYLEFLGISRQKRTYLRMAAALLAMSVYLGLAVTSRSQDPLHRVALPLIIAMASGFALERAFLYRWKSK